jgi:hypothetical protein
MHGGALGRIDLGDDADNVRVDRARNWVLVGYGKGALALIDPRSRAKAAIRLFGQHRRMRTPRISVDDTACPVNHDFPICRAAHLAHTGRNRGPPPRPDDFRAALRS